MSLGYPTAEDLRQDERDLFAALAEEVRFADESRFAFDAADVVDKFRRLREERSLSEEASE